MEISPALETMWTVPRALGVHDALGLPDVPAVTHHPPPVVTPEVGAGGGVSAGYSALPAEQTVYISLSPHMYPVLPRIMWEAVNTTRLKLIFSSFIPHKVIQKVSRAVQEDEETAVLLDDSQRAKVHLRQQKVIQIRDLRIIGAEGVTNSFPRT